MVPKDDVNTKRTEQVLIRSMRLKSSVLNFAIGLKFSINTMRRVVTSAEGLYRRRRALHLNLLGMQHRLPVSGIRERAWRSGGVGEVEGEPYHRTQASRVGTDNQ